MIYKRWLEAWRVRFYRDDIVLGQGVWCNDRLLILKGLVFGFRAGFLSCQGSQGH